MKNMRSVWEKSSMVKDSYNTLGADSTWGGKHTSLTLLEILT